MTTLGLIAHYIVPMLPQKDVHMQVKYLKSRGEYNTDWQNWDSHVKQLNRDITVLQNPTGF